MDQNSILSSVFSKNHEILSSAPHNGIGFALLATGDSRKCRLFEALWSHGASKWVNNMTLHRDNPSKLCLGEFKNKKSSNIIKVSIGPKCGFDLHFRKPHKIPSSNPTTGPPWVSLLVAGISEIFGSSRRSGAMVCSNELIISLYTVIILPSYV